MLDPKQQNSAYSIGSIILFLLRDFTTSYFRIKKRPVYKYTGQHEI